MVYIAYCDQIKLCRGADKSLARPTSRCNLFDGENVSFDASLVIQFVPLATEPGISLIILTPIKILQRNLNRSTFVVWEMKRNVSVVCVCCAPNCCDTEQRSTSQPQ